VGLLTVAGCGGPTETGILINIGGIPAAATTVTMKLEWSEPEAARDIVDATVEVRGMRDAPST